ncbi:MAG TPA: sigma-70 family RNA polymerase sigma factor [Verrucomicrobiota bacterium]|nr:sigma-70 family RNA polymerase sigma factor [Verrucomicrobiota bacterium]
MSDASPPKPEKKTWPPDWTFKQRYEESYADALDVARSRTKDFQLAQDAQQEAAVALGHKMYSGENVTRAEFMTIVRNKAINTVRDKIRRRKIGEPESDFERPTDDGKVIPFLSTIADEKALQPDVATENSEQKTLIGQMLGSLPSKQQAIVWHYYFEGLSQVEVAEQLHITENAVKMALRAIRTLLRERFAAQYAALNY